MGLTKLKNYIPLILYVPWIYLGFLFQVYISFLHSLSSDYIFSLKSQTVSVQFQEDNKYMFFYRNQVSVSYSKVYLWSHAVILGGVQPQGAYNWKKDFQN